jgi:hypothetical protein
MSLDDVVSRMVMRARQFERAVHDPGPWTVFVDGVESSARKVIGDNHVTFYAIVRCDKEAPVAELRCKGDVVAVKQLGPVGHAQIAWGFEIDEAMVAA